MPKLLSALTILTALASGCTEHPKPLPQTRATTTNSHAASTTEVRPAVQSTSSPLRLPPDTTTPAPNGCTLGTSTIVASDFVAALIGGQPTPSVENLDLWRQVVAEGSVIQTTVLSEAAGRATVAVSVAFEMPEQAVIVDPIGLRIELSSTDGCWLVERVSYL